MDRFENKHIKLSLYGKSTALIGDAIKEVIQLAGESKLPIVVEELDFKKKKQSLKDSNPGYARMLSSFSYRKILENFESKAFKEGVEIIHISPAYTSMIGAIKYKKIMVYQHMLQLLFV